MGGETDAVILLVQPEMDKSRPPLMQVPSFRRGLLRHRGFLTLTALSLTSWHPPSNLSTARMNSSPTG